MEVDEVAGDDGVAQVVGMPVEFGEDEGGAATDTARTASHQCYFVF